MNILKYANTEILKFGNIVTLYLWYIKYLLSHSSSKLLDEADIQCKLSEEGDDIITCKFI